MEKKLLEMALQHRPYTTLITKEILNGFRYHVAVNTQGHAVVLQVVQWLYQGSLPIKAYFLSLGHSNGDYKRTFNSSQRTLLESGGPFKKYDIALLYNILQSMCGLARSYDPVWTDPASGQSLEHLLHKIKQKRNDIEHSTHIHQMSDQELMKKLRRLKCLLSKILRVSGNRCGVKPNISRDLVCEVKKHFKGLVEKVREPLQVSDLDKLPQLQQEIKLFQNALRQKVEEDSQRELYDLYPQLWDVVLAQWLYPHLKIRPSLNFAHLVIKEDISSMPPSQRQPPRDVCHVDLLQTTCRSGRLPEVIIISGEGGMGKTTLLKHMLEMWVTDPTQIKGLQDVSLLLYLQLRGSTINSWKDLLKNLLFKTFQNSSLTTDFFVDLFLSYRIVVLLDGYDEANKEAKKLISDLLSIRGNIRVVITTRPGSLKELSLIVQSIKQALVIDIRGICKADRLSFIEKTLDVIVKNPNERVGLKDKILTKFDKLDSDYDLDIPLTMTLLVIREVEAPDQSTQDIYRDLTSLMQGKTVERLIVKGTNDAKNKIKEFLDVQKKVALQSLKRKEHDLLAETFEELKAKCKSLELPYREVFSGFLVSKKSRQGLLTVHIWSFPHNRFQEYWAGDYVVTQLLKISKALPDFDQLLDSLIPVASKEEITLNTQDVPSTNNLSTMFQVNPILQIFAEDLEDAKQITMSDRDNKLLITLRSAVRIMASSQMDLLNKVASGIISLCYFGDRPSYFCERYVDMIMASNNHPAMLKACVKALQHLEDLYCQGRYLPGLVALMDHMTLTSVHVVMLNDRYLLSLKELSQKNVQVILKTGISGGNAQFSERCLETITDPGGNMSLIEFQGILTATGMQFLPESLKECDIESNGEGLQAFVTRLPHLPNLQALRFDGQLTESVMGILPSVLKILGVTTNGEGVRALAERLPYLKNLEKLEIELTDCPPADSLGVLMMHDGHLVLNLRSVCPPSWDWACEALPKLCGKVDMWTRVLVPSVCADEVITKRLRERGVVLRKFDHCDIYVNFGSDDFS